MSDDDRIKLMLLVKEGKISMEEAVERVKLYEMERKRERELRMARQDSLTDDSREMPSRRKKKNEDHRQNKSVSSAESSSIQSETSAHSVEDYFDPPVELSPEEESLVGLNNERFLYDTPSSASGKCQSPFSKCRHGMHIYTPVQNARRKISTSQPNSPTHTPASSAVALSRHCRTGSFSSGSTFRFTKDIKGNERKSSLSSSSGSQSPSYNRQGISSSASLHSPSNPAGLPLVGSRYTPSPPPRRSSSAVSKIQTFLDHRKVVTAVVHSPAEHRKAHKPIPIMTSFRDIDDDDVRPGRKGMATKQCHSNYELNPSTSKTQLARGSRTFHGPLPQIPTTHIANQSQSSESTGIGHQRSSPTGGSACVLVHGDPSRSPQRQSSSAPVLSTFKPESPLLKTSPSVVTDPQLSHQPTVMLEYKTLIHADHNPLHGAIHKDSKVSHKSSKSARQTDSPDLGVDTSPTGTLDDEDIKDKFDSSSTMSVGSDASPPMDRHSAAASTRNSVIRLSWQRSASAGDEPLSSDYEDHEELSKLDQAYRRERLQPGQADKNKSRKKDAKKKVSKVRTNRDSNHSDKSDLSSQTDTQVNGSSTETTKGSPQTEMSGPVEDININIVTVMRQKMAYIAKARAVVDSVATTQQKGLLSYQKGEIIYVVEMPDENMWKGETKGTVGFVKVADLEVLPQESSQHTLGQQQQRHSRTRRVSRKSKPRTVEELLARLGMQHLVTVFQRSGYGNLELFSELEESDLNELHILDPEERAKILTAAELLLDYDTPESPDPSQRNDTARSTPTTDASGTSSQSPATVSSCDSPRHQTSTSGSRDSGCYASNENLLNKDTRLKLQVLDLANAENLHNSSQEHSQVQKQQDLKIEVPSILDSNLQSGELVSQNGVKSPVNTGPSVLVNGALCEPNKNLVIEESGGSQSTPCEGEEGGLGTRVPEPTEYTQEDWEVMAITNGQINGENGEWKATKKVESQTSTLPGTSTSDSHLCVDTQLATKRHSSKGTGSESSDSAMSDMSDHSPKRQTKAEVVEQGRDEGAHKYNSQGQRAPPIPKRPKPRVPERTVSLPGPDVADILCDSPSVKNACTQSGAADNAALQAKVELVRSVHVRQMSVPDASSSGKTSGKHAPSPGQNRRSGLQTFQSGPQKGKQEGGWSGRQALPVSGTLESIIIAKLENEQIDLTELPYTDQVGYCGIPPALVQRYAEEVGYDVYDVAQAVEHCRVGWLQEKNTPAVPNDLLGESCLCPAREANTSSVNSLLTSIGLPMYIQPLLMQGYATIDSVKEMKETDLRKCGINDLRHIKRLLSAIDSIRCGTDLRGPHRVTKVSRIVDKV